MDGKVMYGANEEGWWPYPGVSVLDETAAYGLHSQADHDVWVESETHSFPAERYPQNLLTNPNGWRGKH